MLNFENKRKVITIVVIAVIIFVALFAIINIKSVTGMLSAILGVFTPILLGGAIAYMLNPILKLYEFRIFKKIKSKGALRGLSLVMTYVTGILLLVGFFFLIIPQLITSITDLITKLPGYITNTENYINSLANKIMRNDEPVTYIQEGQILNFANKYLLGEGGILSNLASQIPNLIGGLVTAVKNLVLAIFISLYVLGSKERLTAQMRKLGTALFPDKTKNRLERYLKLANKTFGSFFIGKIIDSLIIGVITFFLLLIFRIPYAFLVSCIVCITNIIPVFGPFIGAIPSFLLIFIANPKKALIFLILIILIQQLDGNVIGPKILGNSTGLSSLGVIISIIIMGAYFGIIGMIIGVPIFAVIVVIVKEFLDTRLATAGLPTDTAEYYTSDSLVNPHEEHQTFSQQLWQKGVHLWEKAVLLFKKLFRIGNTKKGKKAKTKTNSVKKSAKGQKNKKSQKKDDEN